MYVHFILFVFSVFRFFYVRVTVKISCIVSVAAFNRASEMMI